MRFAVRNSFIYRSNYSFNVRRDLKEIHRYLIANDFEILSHFIHSLNLLYILKEERGKEKKNNLYSFAFKLKGYNDISTAMKEVQIT